MRIAAIFEYPSLHGGERSLLAVMDELRRQHVAVEFTAFAPPSGPLADALAGGGIRQIAWSVRDAAGQRRPADEFEASLLAHLQAMRPDLVHANSLSMGRVTGRIADRLPCPATAHLRDIIGLSAAAITDLNRNTRLVAVSTATRDFHAAQGVDAARTTVIYNGINLDQFAPRRATGYLHDELKLPREVRLIAAIGQIGLRKGWAVLAEAMTMSPLSGQPVHLLLIGARHSEKAESKQFEADLRQRVIAAGWKDRVHWIGERSDVHRLLPELDLLVHPARQEPLGRVLIEALACGVPIVATDVGGTREIIESDRSGRLAPAGDATQLAAAISSVLADPELSGRFRREARRRAEQCFDIQDAAGNLWSFWQDVASEHRHRFPAIPVL